LNVARKELEILSRIRLKLSIYGKSISTSFLMYTGEQTEDFEIHTVEQGVPEGSKIEVKISIKN